MPRTDGWRAGLTIKITIGHEMNTIGSYVRPLYQYRETADAGSSPPDSDDELELRVVPTDFNNRYRLASQHSARYLARV